MPLHDVSRVDPPVGQPLLIYRYTVAGADKASIDTGVDVADAGSNDWTGGDLLEVYYFVRTDEGTAVVSASVTLNNDGAGNYDEVYVGGNTTAAFSATLLAQAAWDVTVHGTSGSAYFAAGEIRFPNFTNASSPKSGSHFAAVPDATAGNNQVIHRGLGYRGTAAITRLKIAGKSTAKLKVGSQILIYKRVG